MRHRFIEHGGDSQDEVVCVGCGAVHWVGFGCGGREGAGWRGRVTGVGRKDGVVGRQADSSDGEPKQRNINIITELQQKTQ